MPGRIKDEEVFLMCEHVKMGQVTEKVKASFCMKFQSQQNGTHLRNSLRSSRGNKNRTRSSAGDREQDLLFVAQASAPFQGFRDRSPSAFSGFTQLKDTAPARVQQSRLSASESDNQSWAPRSEFGFDTIKKIGGVLFDPDGSDQDEDNEETASYKENREINTEPVTATTISKTEKDYEDA